MVEELKVLKCPSCGANAELDENQDVGFCKYCRSRIERTKPIVQKIEVTNPVQINGKVQLVNNEFESQLAKVDHMAENYFKDSKKKRENALNIIKEYKELEKIGGNEAKLWEHLLDFFVKVNLDKKIVITDNVLDFEKIFKDIYDMIIKFDKDEAILKSVREKYEYNNIIFQFKNKLKKVSYIKILYLRNPALFCMVIFTILYVLYFIWDSVRYRI